MSSREFSRAVRDAGAAGFTLVEAVAALVVVSLLVPSTMVLLHDAGTGRASPILASRARWLAGEKLEDIIADRHSGTRGWSYVIDATYADEATIAGFAGYARSVTIVETTADLVTAGSGFKRVSVTVSWMDPRRGSASLTLSTVLTDFAP